MADNVTKEIDNKIKDSQKKASDQIDKRLDIVTAAVESQQKEVTADVTRQAEFLTNFMEKTVQASTVSIANTMSDAGKKIEEVEKKGGLARSLAKGVGKFGKFSTRQTIGRVMFKEKLGNWGKGPSDEEKANEERRQEESKRHEVNEQINAQLVKNTSLLNILKFMNDFLMDIDSTLTIMARESVKPRKFAEEIEREKKVREMKLLAIQERMAEAMEALKNKETTVSIKDDKGINWDQRSFFLGLTAIATKFFGGLIMLPAAGLYSMLELGVEGMVSAYARGISNLGKILKSKLWTPLAEGAETLVKSLDPADQKSVQRVLRGLRNVYETVFGSKGFLGRSSKIGKAIIRASRFIFGGRAGFSGVPKQLSVLTRFASWFSNFLSVADDAKKVGRVAKLMTSPIRFFDKIRTFIRGMPRFSALLRTIGQWITPIMAFGEGFIGAFKGFKEGETIMGVDYKEGTNMAGLMGFMQGFQHGAIGWVYTLASDIVGHSQSLAGKALSWIGVKTNWEKQGKELANKNWRGKDGLHETYNNHFRAIFIDPFHNAFLWVREQTRGVKRLTKRMKKKGWIQVIKETLIELMDMLPIIGRNMSRYWAKKFGLNWEEVMGDKSGRASDARREKKRTEATKIGTRQGFTSTEYAEYNRKQFGQSIAQWVRQLRSSNDPAMLDLVENRKKLMSLVTTYDPNQKQSIDEVYNFSLAKQRKRIDQYLQSNKKQTGIGLNQESIDNKLSARTNTQPITVQNYTNVSPSQINNTKSQPIIVPNSPIDPAASSMSRDGQVPNASRGAFVQ